MKTPAVVSYSDINMMWLYFGSWHWQSIVIFFHINICRGIPTFVFRIGLQSIWTLPSPLAYHFI